MADTTNVPVTAVTRATARYLYDDLVAARITDGQGPIAFPHARRIVFRTPITNVGGVYLTKDPKSTAEGERILPDAELPKESGGKLNTETIRNWYVWADNAANKLEVTLEY